jgi:hypothetical protein
MKNINNVITKKWKKIVLYSDLPKYGDYVLIIGKNKRQYDKINMHVACMDDLEDGNDFHENGKFYWLTENGTRIEEVTHWMTLPNMPEDIQL